MHQLWAEERFAGHERKYTTGGGVQPVNRALCGLFTHAFYAVVERPAVMTVEIALPLRKKMRNEGRKCPRKTGGLDIGKSQPVHPSQNRGGSPAPFAGASQGK